jgi:hypothetical protein
MPKFIFSIFILFFLCLFSKANAFTKTGNVILWDSTSDVINFYSNENPDTLIFRKINKDIPTIVINAFLNGKDYLYFPVKNIIIKDSATGKMIQTIDPENDSLGIMNIEFNDFNFDGYLDLYVYDGCAILGNCYGKIYLYNRDLKKFVHDPAFDEMTSVYADKEKKEIRSFNQCCGGSESETKIYTYYDGKLTLIKNISKSYNNKTSKFKYIFKEYDKNGKLFNSKEIISDKYDLDE